MKTNKGRVEQLETKIQVVLGLTALLIFIIASVGILLWLTKTIKTPIHPEVIEVREHIVSK